MISMIQVWVSVALVAGPLACLSVSSRLRISRDPRSFRCRVGTCPQGRFRRGDRWRWRRARALWVSDVLLVQKGLLRLWTTALHARIPTGSHVERLAWHEGRRLGADPVLLRLITDDGQTVVIVAGSQDRALLVGPFLTAAIPGLPSARRELGS